MVRYMDQPTLRRTPWTTLLWYLRHPYLWGTLLAALSVTAAVIGLPRAYHQWNKPPEVSVIQTTITPTPVVITQSAAPAPVQTVRVTAPPAPVQTTRATTAPAPVRTVRVTAAPTTRAPAPAPVRTVRVTAPATTKAPAPAPARTTKAPAASGGYVHTGTKAPVPQTVSRTVTCTGPATVTLRGAGTGTVTSSMSGATSASGGRSLSASTGGGQILLRVTDSGGNPQLGWSYSGSGTCR